MPIYEFVYIEKSGEKDFENKEYVLVEDGGEAIDYARTFIEKNYGDDIHPISEEDGSYDQWEGQDIGVVLDHVTPAQSVYVNVPDGRRLLAKLVLETENG